MYSGMSRGAKITKNISDSNEEEVEKAVKHYRVSLLFMVSSLIALEALG